MSSQPALASTDVQTVQHLTMQNEKTFYELETIYLITQILSVTLFSANKIYAKIINANA